MRFSWPSSVTTTRSSIRTPPTAGSYSPGHVVTVEPGLYDPAIGGVRIEDLVVVTEDGHENLTDYGKRLEL